MPAGDPPLTSSGVDRLIARLRDEGVQQGRHEAAQLVAEAEANARAIVEAAEQEAREIREGARREARNLERAGNDALKVAMRDAVLDLKAQLAERFAGEVARLIADEMRSDDLLRRLILEVAGRVREDARLDDEPDLVVLLPRDVAGLDDLRRHPEEVEQGTLSHFVLEATAGLLRDGVTFGRSSDAEGGIRIELGERGVAVDLTERAVAGVILQHLQPRFRALLEGVVR